MSTLYSIGQMNQLADALETAGFTVDDVTKLRSSPHLRALRAVGRGQVEFQITKHVIDLDDNPFVPKSLTVEKHVRGGVFEWDPAKVDLYLSDAQKSGVIKGDELREELKSQRSFNANLLDYLLVHSNLIPESWKGKYVFFWNTIYRNSDGDRCVRYLRWDCGRWDWGYGRLGNQWYDGSPAAVLANPPATAAS